MARFDPAIRLDPSGFPIFVEPPPASALRALDPNNPDDIATAHEYLAIYGAESPNQIRLRVGRAVQAFPVDSSSPDFLLQLQRIVDELARPSAVQAVARRASERMSMNHQSGGDMSRVAVYVTEDDPCPACDSLGGTTQTLAEFDAKNERPGDQCYQGDSCRCDLVVVV
jgi:hypothetical protein